MTQRAIVTGGNRGIGAAIAETLAARGYAVTILCRSAARAGAFIEEARRRGRPGLSFMPGDLGTITGAKEAAERVMRDAPDTAVFVHNAGIWPVELVLNPDGLEQSFVTNHLGPFIMNTMLADRFAANGTRVVQVSAGLYRAGLRDCRAAATGANFSLLRTYATTKLFNLICTMRFARQWRGRGMTINAVHPGVVRTGLGDLPGFGGRVLRLLKRACLTPAQGAAAPVMLAVDPAYASATGGYYERFTAKRLGPIAGDESFNEELWRQAQDLCFGR